MNRGSGGDHFVMTMLDRKVETKNSGHKKMTGEEIVSALQGNIYVYEALHGLPTTRYHKIKCETSVLWLREGFKFFFFMKPSLTFMKDVARISILLTLIIMI